MGWIYINKGVGERSGGVAVVDGCLVCGSGRGGCWRRLRVGLVIVLLNISNGVKF